MDITELEQESAELLPDRQALGCWNYGWHQWHSCNQWQGWNQSWHQSQGWDQCWHSWGN
ncbi:MAG: hypothetical protein JO016_01530 [Actinobacteria bacterium]|nr:hypothetical protein [Actinomycetota bacterium]